MGQMTEMSKRKNALL